MEIDLIIDKPNVLERLGLAFIFAQCHNFSFIFTITHCDAMAIKDESGQHTAQQIQTRKGHRGPGAPLSSGERSGETGEVTFQPINGMD